MPHNRLCLALLFACLLAVTSCAPTSSIAFSGLAALPATNTPVATPAPILRIVSAPTAVSTTQPDITPTPLPTATATAAFTATAVPTHTPRPTHTPTPTVTPTASGACGPAAISSQTAIPPGPWVRPAASNAVIGYGPRDPGRKFIHLSFDVEGDPLNLNALLNVLDKHGVKTTMFVIGSWAVAHEEWIIKIARHGHELGNHSYSHSDLRQFTAEQIQAELRLTENIVMSLTGQSTQPWLRPPYGGYSESTVQAAYEAGWTTVMWSGSGADTNPNASEETICNALMQYAEPGAILLLHTSKSFTVTAVDRFITEMHRRGYTFVPLSVLMAGS